MNLDDDGGRISFLFLSFYILGRCFQRGNEMLKFEAHSVIVVVTRDHSYY